MTENAVEAKLRITRVARLSTRDPEGWPHVIPVCFVYHRDIFYTPLDRKPKRVSVQKLARVRNIEANPEVALLLDQYDEDWDRLWYILVRGQASILTAGAEQNEVIAQLRNKYEQYISLEMLPADAPLIRIAPVNIISWGRL